ncbi:hypothetical protein Fmac_022475 [Flemingia macrophylla]|uniref:Small auxin up regulated protein n=1 Tax=Flemingia macrophylla TaxID=520843 RepID=A0ABD1LZU3_9FABA
MICLSHLTVLHEGSIEGQGYQKGIICCKSRSSKAVDVPKGYLTAYVGEKMKRFMIPVSYLNQPSFQELLSQAEEEFGYHHPIGALTIPSNEDGIRLPGIKRSSVAATKAASKVVEVPKGYPAVYVGEKKKPFVIPVSYLNQPLFQELLIQAEEEFRYESQMLS